MDQYYTIVVDQHIKCCSIPSNFTIPGTGILLFPPAATAKVYLYLHKFGLSLGNNCRKSFTTTPVGFSRFIVVKYILVSSVSVILYSLTHSAPDSGGYMVMLGKDLKSGPPSAVMDGDVKFPSINKI